MPDNWKCEHYQQGEYRPRITVESILPGPDLDVCPYCGKVIELRPYGMGVVGICCKGVVINRGAE